MNVKLVSIILPTFNEKDNIISLIKTLEKEVKFKNEIIVVDDSSPDGTSDEVNKYIKRNNKRSIKVILRKKNRGLTNSLKDGIKASKGDTVAWMDADFSMPPKILNLLIKKTEEGFDIAVGSRFIKGGKIKKAGKKDSLAAIVLSRLMNFTIQFLLGRHFRDYTSGFVAAKREVFNKITLRGDYGEYFIDFIYKAFIFKFTVIELPYVCLPRRKGESKTGSNLWQYSKRGIKYIFLTFRLLYERYILKKFP
ncbi:glycosyltransferase [Candidatus Daviesbacteria bacterium]|nr:glycosyltransferase [Candidatus Daviesbacteria bacterium]